MRTIPLPAALLAACFLLPAAAQTPSLAGKWNWRAGSGIVEIDAAGSGRDSRGNTVRWTLQDPAAFAKRIHKMIGLGLELGAEAEEEEEEDEGMP